MLAKPERQVDFVRSLCRDETWTAACDRLPEIKNGEWLFSSVPVRERSAWKCAILFDPDGVSSDPVLVKIVYQNRTHCFRGMLKGDDGKALQWLNLENNSLLRSTKEDTFWQLFPSETGYIAVAEFESETPIYSLVTD